MGEPAEPSEDVRALAVRVSNIIWDAVRDDIQPRDHHDAQACEAEIARLIGTTPDGTWREEDVLWMIASTIRWQAERIDDLQARLDEVCERCQESCSHRSST
jgi:hypothetical protein